MKALCPDCESDIAPDDNYCRQCGMFLATDRAVLIPEPATPAIRSRATLPAPVARTVTAVAVGTAVQITFSLAARYLASQAARSAAKAVVSRPRTSQRPAKGEVVETRTAGLPDDTAAVSETLILRRVWIRRS